MVFRIFLVLHTYSKNDLPSFVYSWYIQGAMGQILMILDFVGTPRAFSKHSEYATAIPAIERCNVSLTLWNSYDATNIC